MEHVEPAGRLGDLSGVLAPGPYLELLPVLSGQLPSGDSAFAADPDHCDFSGRRCVKDLLPARARRTGDADLEIRFAHNCWKHDEDLVVRHSGVSRFRTDVLGVRALGVLGVRAFDAIGAVVLDEILPHPGGRTHEPARRPGTLLVVRPDPEAEWVAADCPEHRDRRGLPRGWPTLVG
ncbi:hypothetical protein [Streptomyces sp. NPDC003401]